MIVFNAPDELFIGRFFMTSTLITREELQKHVETDLEGTALDRLIASADAEIVHWYGDHTDLERMVNLRGGTRKVRLPYPEASSIIEVKDYDPDRHLPGQAEVVEATEYALVKPGQIVRIGYSFKPRVIVRYMPVNDNDRRVHILIDLVQLAITYEAERVSTVGDRGSGISVEHVNYERERRNILDRLTHLSYGLDYA